MNTKLYRQPRFTNLEILYKFAKIFFGSNTKKKT